MTTCTVANSSAISCDYGCCGTGDKRTCCEFTLSESVIIVICVVGALVVVAIVVALIICLTSKQKNRVTRIRLRQRHNRIDNELRTRPIEVPKPPPYSETPPQYDFLPGPEESRSTEPILPRYRTTNARPSREPRSSRRQNPPLKHRNAIGGQQSDAPPTYISVINMEQSGNLDDRCDTPEPGTSGLGRLTGNGNDVMDGTRHGSPHPSLASGRISSIMFNGLGRNGTLHKTTSERSRRQFRIGGNNSVTPVSVREITVHSHVINGQNTGNERTEKEEDQMRRNNAFTSKIPRPSKRKTSESESRSEIKSSSVASTTELLPGALESTSPLEQSPPPTNPAAAVRSAQRHAVLQRLQKRMEVSSPTPVQ